MKYHCLECGAELIQKNVSDSTDRYDCPRCNTVWYRVRRIIVEWVSNKDLAEK